jgi:hypothetical protein
MRASKFSMLHPLINKIFHKGNNEISFLNHVVPTYTERGGEEEEKQYKELVKVQAPVSLFYKTGTCSFTSHGPVKYQD